MKKPWNDWKGARRTKWRTLRRRKKWKDGHGEGKKVAHKSLLYLPPGEEEEKLKMKINRK